MNVYAYFVAGWLLLVGGYGIVRSRHMVHAVVCLAVAQSGTYVLLLAVGYQRRVPAPVFGSHREAEQARRRPGRAGDDADRHRRLGDGDRAAARHRGAGAQAARHRRPQRARRAGGLSRWSPSTTASHRAADRDRRADRRRVRACCRRPPAAAPRRRRAAATGGRRGRHRSPSRAARRRRVASSPGRRLDAEARLQRRHRARQPTRSVRASRCWSACSSCSRWSTAGVTSTASTRTTTPGAAVPGRHGGFALTGDLFDMFVFFELMGAAAYALTGFKIEDRSAVQGALNFGVVNSLGAYIVADRRRPALRPRRRAQAAAARRGARRARSRTRLVGRRVRRS